MSVCVCVCASNNTICLTNSKIVYCLVCLFLFCSLFAFFFVFFFSSVFFFFFSDFLVFFCGLFCFVSSFSPLCPPCFRGRGSRGGGGEGRGWSFSLVFSTSVECRPMTPFLPLPFLVYCLVCLLFLLFLCLFKNKFGSCFFFFFFSDFLGSFFLCGFCLVAFLLLSFHFLRDVLFFSPFFGGVGGWGARFVFIWVFPPSVAWSFLPSFLRYSFCLFVVYFWIFSFLSFFFLCFFVYVGCPFFFIFL